MRSRARRPGEPVIVKRVNPAFIGIDLEARLRAAGPDGDHHRAEDVHAMTLANLAEEFARIVETADVAAALGPRSAPASA